MWRAAHRAFGSTVADEDPDGDLSNVAFAIRFPGQYADSESALHYNRFRAYDPALGRYSSADPLGQLDQSNLYQYAFSSPLVQIDPMGLYSSLEFLIDLSNFSAGFGDSLSFGLTSLARDLTGANAVVDKCSKAYDGGEYVEVGLEIAATGGSAALKHLAKGASRKAVRREAWRLTRHIPRNGRKLHHRNPLFGHPGGGSTPFPTGGLPGWIAHHPWNRALLDPAAHAAAHARLKALEALGAAVVNPLLTAGRVAKNALADCECEE